MADSHDEAARGAARGRALVEQLPDAAVWLDARRDIHDCNAAFVALVDRPRSELLGQRLDAVLVLTPACRVAVGKIVEQTLAGQPGVSTRVELQSALTLRRLELRTYGANEGLVACMCCDVTDSEERDRMHSILRYALEHISEGVFLMRGDSPDFEYVNRSAADTLGYTVDQLTHGMSVPDIDPSMTREAWETLTPEVRRRRRMNVETTHRTRDGRLLPVEITGNFFDYGGEQYNLAITRSTAERRAAEQALKASEAAYRSLVDHLPDLVVRWDRTLSRVLVNHAFAEAMGAPPGVLAGETFGHAHPDEAAPGLTRTRAQIARVFETGVPVMIEEPLQTPRGLLPVQLHLVPEVDESGEVRTVLGIARDISRLKRTEEELRGLVDNSPDLILRYGSGGQLTFANMAPTSFLRSSDASAGAALLSRLRAELERPLVQPRTVECELRLSDGARFVEARLVPEPQAGGEASVLVLARDMSAARVLAAQLREAQRLELIGRLAGGIAHDFNNYLTIMKMSAELIEAEITSADTVRETCQDLRAALDRASNLTRQLLTFSRRQPTAPADVAVGARLGELSRLLARLLGAGITLDIETSVDTPNVEVDPAMFEQVVMNLALNARDAMSGQGRLSIRAGLAEAPQGRTGRFVRLDVRDEGVGIPPEVLPHVFEPFYTTKDLGKGTGLGLATVQAIAQQHGGSVSVDSVLGRGTTFSVYFPVAEAAPVADAPAERPAHHSGGSELVLLVDDEPGIRRSSRVALERRGYAVFDAASADEAEALWANLGGNVRLLVTDVVMPGRSGRQLVARLRETNPRLRVLYITGFAPEGAASLGLGPRTHLLHKPFDAEQLAVAVRAAIDAS
jgi:PAS domain S-box-containing protein